MWLFCGAIIGAIMTVTLLVCVCMSIAAGHSDRAAEHASRAADQAHLTTDTDMSRKPARTDPGPGIETAVAAERLGVHPSTLRLWVAQFGFPSAHRSGNGRTRFDPAEIEALHAALQSQLSVSDAINAAQARGTRRSAAH